VALLGVLVWRSLGWPLIHDAPLMHYVAWLIAQGAVPYRDVFDMNLPGVYVIHLAVLEVGGPGDLAWRLFDLGWLAATCALLAAFCRPVSGAWAAAGGAALFALYHLSGGAWRVGQRDFLLCLFLLAGVFGMALAIERHGALAPLLAGGLALGAAMTVKPHAGLLWIGCILAVVGTARRQRFPVARSVCAVAGAALVIPVLLFGWLAWRGGLGPFVDILTGYVLPLYSRVGRTPPWAALRWYEYGWQLWLLFAGLAAVALLSAAREGFAARKRLAVMGAGYGGLHFWLQGKGWEYQLYPLALFLCALAPLAAVRAQAASRALPWAVELRRGVALVLWVGLVVVLGVKGAHALDAPWIAEKAHRVAAVTSDLRRLLPPRGDGPAPTVQVMDVTEGGIHALFELGLREPTRFLYDFHFFHDEGDARIQALRAEFARALEAGRPAAIVVFRDTWNRPGYGRLSDFPEVQRLLAESYRLAVEGDGYRIYAKRSHS
jgi:hypothetical protein